MTEYEWLTRTHTVQACEGVWGHLSTFSGHKVRAFHLIFQRSSVTQRRAADGKHTGELRV